MSDQSQGPGWWQASDGKWYPPEQAPTAPQPVAPSGPPPYGPPGGPPAYAAPAAAAGGGGAGKIIAIVVAAVLIVGGAAFLLTRDSDSGASFCDQAKAVNQNKDFENITDPTKSEKAFAAIDKALKAAPAEIKADAQTLRDGFKKLVEAVKQKRDLQTVFTEEEDKKLTEAGDRVEAYGFKNCPGSGFSDSTSSSSNPFSDFSSFGSDFSFDSDSFNSQLSQFSDNFSDFFSSDFFNSDFFSSN